MSDTCGLFAMRYSQTYFNIASLTTIIVQYRRSVKHAFSV